MSEAGGDFADRVIAFQGSGEVFVSFIRKAVDQVAAQAGEAYLLGAPAD